jgi:hypothetical protein
MKESDIAIARSAYTETAQITCNCMTTISDSMANVIGRGELLEKAGYILDRIHCKTGM